jgi:uncharacterized membrane protein
VASADVTTVNAADLATEPKVVGARLTTSRKVRGETEHHQAALSSRSATKFVAVAALMHALLIFFLAWNKHRNFDTYGFDFGIYDQAWWLVGQHGTGFDTVRGLAIWGHHPNFVLYLLAPFARLGLGNWFLIAVQTSVISAGALPVSWIARDRLKSARAGLLFAGVYLLYPPTSWLSWAPFHPECLSVTPMLFAMWFASRRKWWPYALCLALVMSTREEAAIMVALYGVVLVWQHRRRSPVDAAAKRSGRIVGVLTFIAGIAWFMICMKVIIPAALGGQGAFYVNHFFAAYGDSLGGVAVHLATHPGEIVRVSTTPQALTFQTELFGPLGWLPFFGSPVSLIALPQLASTLLGSESFLRRITNQYTALMVPGLIVGTIDAVARIRRRWSTTKPMVVKVAFGWLIVSTVFGAYLRGPLPGAVGFSSWRQAPPENAAVLNEAIAMVPSGAAVAASGELVPHLSHREVIYNFPNPFEPLVYGLDDAKPDYPKPADWVVVNYAAMPPKWQTVFDRVKATGDWTVMLDRYGVVVLKRTVAQ